MTPWGRDSVETVSKTYNVAITKRKRQIPLQRNGRPTLVQRAEPYAASRRPAQAAIQWRLLGTLTLARLATLLQTVGMSEVRADQLAETLSQARSAGEAYDKLYKALGSKADYIAKQLKLDEASQTQGPKAPSGYKLTTVDQLVVGDEIITYPHGKDVVEKVASRRNAVKTRGGQIIGGKATIYVKASRRAARASRRVVFEFPSERHANAFASDIDGQQGVLSYAHSPGDTKVYVRTMDDWFGDHFAKKYKGEEVKASRRRAASATEDRPLDAGELRERLWTMLLNRKTANYKYLSGSEQREFLQIAGELAKLLGTGRAQVISQARRDAMSGRASRRRRPAAQANIGLLVARIAPILLRFGLTAERAEAVAQAVTKSANAYEAYQKLRDELGGAAEGVAKALGLDKQARASRRSARAGVGSGYDPFDPANYRHSPKQEGSSYVDLDMVVNDEDELQYLLQPFGLKYKVLEWNGPAGGNPFIRLIGDADSLRKFMAGEWDEDLHPIKAMSASRRSARAGLFGDLWETGKGYVSDLGEAAQDVAGFGDGGKDDDDDEPEVKASTIDDMEMAVRLLVDYQVDRPSKLPPEAEREFWSYMAKVSSSKRSSSEPSKQRATRASRLARVACKCARRHLTAGKKPTAAAGWGSSAYKDSIKHALLDTWQVSLKVDCREGTYESAKDLAEHVDGALQNAGLNAYNIYVR